jgi:predicted phosphodiesterase
MRIALVSDIHGNLISLEAVLADLAREAVDQILCLGDVAALGPQPRETLARLRGLAFPTVMGNTDAWLLNPILAPDADDNLRLIQTVELWSSQQIQAEDRDFIASFEPVISLDLDGGGQLLAFHGSPRSNTEIIRATTPEEDLDRIFSGTRALILAGGHTHQQLLRRYRDSLLINPGSVGLPQERDPQTGAFHNPPWAEYAIVLVDGGRLHVDLRRISVDAAAIIRSYSASGASGMPYADRLAGDWE